MLPCCNLSLTLHVSETSSFLKYGAKIIQLWIFLTLKATTSPTAGDRWHQNLEQKYTVYFYLEWQTLHKCPSLSASYFVKRQTTGHSASIQIYKYQMSSSLQLPLLSLPLSVSYSPFLSGSLALEDSRTVYTSEDLQEVLFLQKVKVMIMQRAGFSSCHALFQSFNITFFLLS